MSDNYTGFADLTDMLDEYSRLQFVVEQHMNGLATSALVEVQAVDRDKHTVDVQVLSHQMDGASTQVPHGTIHGLPYGAMQAGGSLVACHPRVGDKGLASFCHSDITSVKANKAASVPTSRRRYSWSDGIYVGGLPGLNGTPTQTIEIDDDVGIMITAAAGKAVAITAPGGVTITGDVTVTGTLTASGDVVGNGTSLHMHRHGGITAGSGTSGAPV